MKTRLYEVEVATSYGGGLLVIEATTVNQAEKMAKAWCASDAQKNAGYSAGKPTPVKMKGENGIRCEFAWTE